MKFKEIFAEANLTFDDLDKGDIFILWGNKLKKTSDKEAYDTSAQKSFRVSLSLIHI